MWISANNSMLLLVNKYVFISYLKDVVIQLILEFKTVLENTTQSFLKILEVFFWGHPVYVFIDFALPNDEYLNLFIKNLKYLNLKHSGFCTIVQNRLIYNKVNIH